MIQDDFDNNENKASVLFVNTFANQKARDSISFIFRAMNLNDIKISNTFKRHSQNIFLYLKDTRKNKIIEIIKYLICIIFTKSKLIQNAYP